MTREGTHIRRRQFLKAAGTTSMLCLAGCSSQQNSSGNNSGSGGASGGQSTAQKQKSKQASGKNYWPPPQNTVNMLTPANPGDLRDTLPRYWMNTAKQYYPDNVKITTTSMPGAEGLVELNKVYSSSPNGGTIGATRALSAGILQIARSKAKYDMTKFQFVVQFFAGTRALQINPKTTPVTKHFQWSWDDFVNYCKKNEMKFGIATPAQRLYANLLRSWEPRLSKDNWQFVNMPGGSETRAAMLRGDLDGYFGSYDSNISSDRTRYYKTQFCMINPKKYPDFFKTLQSIKPNDAPNMSLPKSACIVNTSYPHKKAEKLVTIVLDYLVGGLPPKTPDQVYKIHENTLAKVAKDPTVKKKVAKTFSPQSFDPLTGKEVQTRVNNKIHLLNTDPEVTNTIKNIFS